MPIRDVEIRSEEDAELDEPPAQVFGGSEEVRDVAAQVPHVFGAAAFVIERRHGSETLRAAPLISFEAAANP